MVQSILFAGGALCAAGFLLLLRWKATGRNPKNLPLPPGPEPLPILGNLFDIPTEKAWLTIDEWVRKYGTILSPTSQPFAT